MLNKGISFGLFPGLPHWIFAAFIFYLIIVAVKMRELWGRIGVIMIIVGGSANLYSRIIHGGVVDNMRLFGLVYNNLADYLIFVGLVVYVYSYCFRR